MIEDWYQRLAGAGVLDVLAPYQPAVVGAYRWHAAEGPVEIVCRATDLPAFATVVERAYGSEGGFALHGGSLDGEEAVFAELALEGLPLEIAAQPEHVAPPAGSGDARHRPHRSRSRRRRPGRLAAAVAAGDDWLERRGRSVRPLTDGARVAREREPGPGGAGDGHPPPRAGRPRLRDRRRPGVAAEILIVAAGAARGSQEYTGLMLMLQAVVLGLLFGARLGLVAALAPLAGMGAVIASSITVGSETCSPDCGQQSVSYLFVGVLVAAAAGTAGVLRDRYFPRAA